MKIKKPKQWQMPQWLKNFESFIITGDPYDKSYALPRPKKNKF